MTDKTLAELYRRACAEDRDMQADVGADELIALAHGRLAGARRQAVVAAIARSPGLAAAWRIARDSGPWASAVAAELAAVQSPAVAGSPAIGPGVRPAAAPSRSPAPVFRLPASGWAMAAAVGTLAVATAFLAQPWLQPAADDGNGLASHEVPGPAQVDAILTTSFDRGQRGADPDVIFSARLPSLHQDGIFDGGFGNGGT